jgi:NarL family two-component system response regulator YdfI
VVAAAAGAAAERAPGAGPPAPVRSSHDGYGPLSEREAAVLRLIAAGTREERAAQELHLSRNTVKTYLRRVCAKLDAPSRAAAIRVAIERGLIPDRRRAAR